MTRVSRPMNPNLGGVTGESTGTGETLGVTPDGDPAALLERADVDPAAQRDARMRAMGAGGVIAKLVVAAIEAITNTDELSGAMAKLVAQSRDDLQDLGYPVGEDPTRLDDPTTVSSIKKYQEDHGLGITGEMDAETMMSMVESLMNQRRAARPPAPRANSSWSSGNGTGGSGAGSGGAPSAPRSNTGYSAPGGDFSRAPAAAGSDRGVSRGPAPNGKVDLSTPEGKQVFIEAGKAAGMSEVEATRWANSPALKSLVNHESGGVVGRPNYTYGNKDAATVHAELKAGKITAKSSATGLGQLLLSNVDRYYPKGRAGIGDPVQEAAGMMAYIKDRYGTPEVAWGNHSANPRRHQGVPRIYSAEGY